MTARKIRPDDTVEEITVEDATVPEAYESGEESPENDTENYIVYRIPKMVDGVQMNDEYRIPVSQREEFEKEHGL